MTTNHKKHNLICNIISFALLLIMLGTQFLPFWYCDNCKNHEQGRWVSLSEYTWLTKNHTPITKGMTDVYLDVYGEDYKDENGKKFKFQPNDAILPTVAVFAATIATVVLFIKKSKTPLASIAPFAGGAASVVGYLIIPARQVGYMWQVHLIVAIVLTLFSGGFLAYRLIQRFQKKLAKRA